MWFSIGVFLFFLFVKFCTESSEADKLSHTGDEGNSPQFLHTTDKEGVLSYGDLSLIKVQINGDGYNG